MALSSKKKFRAALIVFAGLSAITAGAVLYLWRNMTVHSISVPLPTAAAQAFLSLTGVHQTATQDGKVQWKLDAHSAELESASGRMLLKAPQVTFFLDDGGQVILTAEEGTLETNTNDMQVEGNVRIVEQRYTMTTTHLAYHHTERLLVAGQAVHIFGRTADLVADRMQYDLSTKRARFDGHVKGNLNEVQPF